MTKTNHASKSASKKTTKRKLAKVIPFIRPREWIGVHADLTDAINSVHAAVRAFNAGPSAATERYVTEGVEHLKTLQASALALVMGTHRSGRYYKSPLSALGRLLGLADEIDTAIVTAHNALRDARTSAVADVIDLATVRRGIALAKRRTA